MFRVVWYKKPQLEWVGIKDEDRRVQGDYGTLSSALDIYGRGLCRGVHSIWIEALIEGVWQRIHIGG